MPDAERCAAAIHIIKRTAVIIADPYGSRQIGGEAYKPGILIIVGSTGFTGCRAAYACTACSTVNKDVAHDIDSLISGFSINYSFGFLLMFKNNFTVTVNYFDNSSWSVVFAAVTDRAIGSCHFQRRSTFAQAA